jgi:predicted PurR-regulated permease PerM
MFHLPSELGSLGNWNSSGRWHQFSFLKFTHSIIFSASHEVKGGDVATNMTTNRTIGPTIAFLVCLSLVLVLVFRMIAPYILAIFMGQILALLAQGPYRWLRRKGMSPNWAGMITAIAMVLIVIGPILTFTVIAGKQALAFADWVSSADHSRLLASLDRVLHSVPFEFLVGDDVSPLQLMRDQMASVGAAASAIIVQLARSTPEAILQLFLAGIAGFYLLVDRERFSRWMVGKLPFDRQFREQVGAAFRDTAISVVWASMAAAAVQAALMTIGFAVLKIPGAFLAGGATFVFAWIPLLGSIPVLIAGIVYLVVNELYAKLAVLLVIGGIAGIADNFVRPAVLGGRGEMHPLVSLVAIFGGVNLFGIFGVFVGPILAAILITLLQIWPIVGRRAGLEFGDG